MNTDRRRHKRVPVDFPVVCKFQGKTVLGQAVNACNEGILVESYVGLEPALHLLKNLANNGKQNVGLRFGYKMKAYRTSAELKHCRLHFLGTEVLRAELGFFVPKMQ
jgi:hypothetical protein